MKKTLLIIAFLGFPGLLYPQLDKGFRVGFEAAGRENEITPAFVMEFEYGLYGMVGPKINSTIILKDPNNSNKQSASWSGLVTLGGILAGSVIHTEDAGEGFVNTVRYIIMVPLFLMNSEHNFFFISPYTTSFDNFRASLFINSRTDIFTKWYRYSVGTGINVETGSSVVDGGIDALQIGVETPCIGKGNYDRKLKWFVGLRILFGKDQ